MTRATNARIAGFTYLFYAAIGICLELVNTLTDTSLTFSAALD